MAPFEFNSTTHFVASSESTTIDVYELTLSTTSPSSAVRTTDWKIVATVAATSHHQQENQYDALKLFEEEITGRDLRNLAEVLSQSHFYVNPLGNCFIDVSAGDGEFVDPAFGVQFLRLNDTFNWSQYGAVNPPSAVHSRQSVGHPPRVPPSQRRKERGDCRLQEAIEREGREIGEIEDSIEIEYPGSGIGEEDSGEVLQVVLRFHVQVPRHDLGIRGCGEDPAAEGEGSEVDIRGPIAAGGAD
ncbi:unnamed protein product [Linum trigynum]